MKATSFETVQPPLAADDAFAILGNPIRIQILHALGEADGPLSFSELRDRVRVSDSGQFNYHLDKLEGAFVGRGDGGYSLLQAGRRVVEAIYSGVLTTEPGVERVQIDRPCSFCGAPIDVRVAPGNIEMYCTSCGGAFGESTSSGRREPAARGYLGKLTLPPAGFQGRSAEEIYHAAQVHGHLEILSIANGVCPRCSARLDHCVDVCGDHDAGDDLCATCGNRYAIMLDTTCTNCIFRARGHIGILLYGHPSVQALKVGQGVNLVAPGRGEDPLSDVEEDVRSTEPFSAHVTYRTPNETLTLAIDDELNVTDVSST